MISQEKISEIVSKIVFSYNPDRIILFGSYANGTPNEDSDLDLLIVKNTDMPRPERIIQLRKSLWGSMIPIDLIVYTPNEINDSKDKKSSFIYEVINTGRILYERQK